MARWGRGPNRAFGHVHNWKLTLANWEDQWSTNEQGWQGRYVGRYWACIRGGKEKHRKHYQKVFIAASGYIHNGEDPY